MELVKRSISGILYVAAMLAAFCMETNMIFFCVFSFLAFVGVWEYSTLVGVNRTRQLRTMLDGLAAAALGISVGFLHMNDKRTCMILLGAYCFYLGYIFIRSIYSEREKMPSELALTFFGQIYVALPLMLAYVLKGMGGVYGGLLTLTFIGIWANDTGAFIFGTLLGKHRLFPSVSPKKSWEGFFGGILASILTAYFLSPYLLGEEQNICTSALLGLIISVFATWGDLFESMLKRNAGVKDSGWILPGHGGILDRIDSALFVIPAVLAFMLIRQLW